MFKLNKILLIIFVSLCLVLPLPVMALQAIGKITRINGRVTIYRDGSKIGITALNGMELQQNDSIKTNAKAYLRFQLNDGSIMTLGEKAELSLDQFNYNPEKKKRVAFFKIAMGKLRIFANQMLKYRDNRFQIKTPTAVAGVRGTVFMVWVESPLITRIACFDSAVEVANVFKPDDSLVITKNILTSVSGDSAPTPPVLMTEEMFQEFQSGFEGEIKPVDEETGFRPGIDADDDDESGESGKPGDVPDPSKFDEEGYNSAGSLMPDEMVFDEAPQFVAEPTDALPDNVIDEVVDDTQEADNRTDTEPEPEPDIEPQPVIIVLPTPPAAPSGK